MNKLKNPKNFKSKKKEAEIKKSQPVKESKKVSTDSVLLQEINSLGGSTKDLELIEGILSDEELIGGENEDENEKDQLKLELGNFIKSLGINKITPSSYNDEVETSDESEVEEKRPKPLKNKEMLPNKHAPNEPLPEFNPADSVVEPQAANREYSTALLQINTSIFKPFDKQLLESTPFWHQILLPKVEEGPAFSSDFASKLREQAKNLLEKECDLATKKIRSTDLALLKKIMQSGTLSDKISALTLKVQEAPIHHIPELSKILSMMKENNRREAIPALNSFKDLCVGNLLPSNRKLKFFEDQPLSCPNLTREHLIVWYFEDYLKKAFFDFLLLCEARSQDPVGISKTSMLGHFYELLAAKPEQEANVLSLLVNKLSDKDGKIASRASFMILKVIERHPGMKDIIITAIESLILRSHATIRTQYYSTITLNQLVLSNHEVLVANHLMEIYFGLFKKFLIMPEGNPMSTKPKKDSKKKKDRHRDRAKNKNNKTKDKGKQNEAYSESQMMSVSRAVAAVLTGVNRAFPYAQIEAKVLDEHAATLFQICRTFTFNAAIQAMYLLHQISKLQPKFRPQLSKALYATLLDPRIIHSSKQSMHLNLLFKVLKDETSLTTIVAFVKRMCQSAAWHQPPYVNGLLYLIFKLASIHPVIKSGIIHVEDPECPHNSTTYKGRIDDPSKSHAEYASLWELGLLLQHFHPTVTHYVRQLLRQEVITDQPALHQHTLVHFLDRFSYRNAKKSNGGELRGSSIMQPLLASTDAKESSGIFWARGSGLSEADQVNTDEFALKQKDEVASDQLFFHKYFNLAKDLSKSKKAKETNKDTSDSEEEFFNSLVGKMGDAECDDDDDDDVDVDYDDDDDDDDDEGVNSDNSFDRNDGANNNLSSFEDALSFEEMVNQEDMAFPKASQGDSDGDDDDESASHDDIDFNFDSDDGQSKKSNKRAKTDVEDEPKSAKALRNKASKERRKKLKALPTFASVDDYAEMLSD